MDPHENEANAAIAAINGTEERLAAVDSVALVHHRAATDAAGLCRELVLKTASRIQGKTYVNVEGWQAIANTYGCTASACCVERVDGGVRATGQVIRISDGKIISQAEGFVGDDEATWKRRPEFARRAMAQTRAMSRACRSAFAFVVTMMDANLQTTPAEEMQGTIEAANVSKPKPKEKKQTDSKKLFETAKLAIEKSKTMDELDMIYERVDQRVTEKVFTAAQAKKLREMCKKQMQTFTEDVEDAVTTA